MKDLVGEAFDLKLVRVSILSERPMKLACFGRKTLDCAGFVEPGQKCFSLNAALLAMDPETLLELAMDWYGQLQMRQRAARQVCFDEPATCPEPLSVSRSNRYNLYG